MCALLAVFAITSLALVANGLFPSLARGEVAVATARPQTPPVPLKRLLLSSSVSRGEKFYSKCASCHSVGRSEPTKIGPNLWNIVFNKVAAERGFNYSPALRARAHMKWGFEALNKFLKAPSSNVRGTYMAFSGLADPADRMDVLSYLNSRSIKPRDIARLRFKR